MVPADCLLLAGTCIAEEAVLTGESTPQWKVPATELDPKATLNMKLVRVYFSFFGMRYGYGSPHFKCTLLRLQHAELEEWLCTMDTVARGLSSDS